MAGDFKEPIPPKSTITETCSKMHKAEVHKTKVLPNLDVLQRKASRENRFNETTSLAFQTGQKSLRWQVPQWILYLITEIYVIKDTRGRQTPF